MKEMCMDIYMGGGGGGEGSECVWRKGGKREERGGGVDMIYGVVESRN